MVHIYWFSFDHIRHALKKNSCFNFNFSTMHELKMTSALFKTPTTAITVTENYLDLTLKRKKQKGTNHFNASNIA